MQDPSFFKGSSDDIVANTCTESGVILKIYIIQARFFGEQFCRQGRQM